VAPPTPKTLAELLNRSDPAWPIIQKLVAGAAGRARVLPTTRARGEQALLALQMTTRSFLGGIAYESGGLAVGHGWLRLLGAGGAEMATSLVSVNQLERYPGLAPDAVGLIVAVDVLGGLFAMNTGKLPAGPGFICYMAPDTLDWLDAGMTYQTFFQWALSSKVDDFYRELRWPGWEAEVGALPLDQGLHVLPPLCAVRVPGVPTLRKPVPIDELWRLTLEMSRQLHAQGVKPGDRVKLKVTD
jgi:hypothetical protein